MKKSLYERNEGLNGCERGHDDDCTTDKGKRGKNIVIGILAGLLAISSMFLFLFAVEHKAIARTATIVQMEPTKLWFAKIWHSGQRIYYSADGFEGYFTLADYKASQLGVLNEDLTGYSISFTDKSATLFGWEFYRDQTEFVISDGDAVHKDPWEDNGTIQTIIADTDGDGVEDTEFTGEVMMGEKPAQELSEIRETNLPLVEEGLEDNLHIDAPR